MKNYLFYKNGNLFLSLNLSTSTQAVKIAKMFKNDFNCSIQLATLLNQSKKLSI